MAPRATPSTRPSAYAERLAQHIDAYVEAVIDQPAVRAAEFAQLKAHAALARADRLLELPAEGRMLEALYPGADIVHADFLRLRVGGAGGYGDAVRVTDWRLSGLADADFDAVLAVVPLHHADASEKRDYLRHARRVLRPGGVLAFGEVEHGSAEHRFLDGFMNRHTRTGHRGDYPDASFADVLREAGFASVRSQVLPCPWRFASIAACHAYLNRLLDLRPMPAAELTDAVADALGLRVLPGGGVEMAWSLRYFRGVRPLVG